MGDTLDQAAPANQVTANDATISAMMTVNRAQLFFYDDLIFEGPVTPGPKVRHPQVPSIFTIIPRRPDGQDLVITRILLLNGDEAVFEIADHVVLRYGDSMSCHNGDSEVMFAYGRRPWVMEKGESSNG